jgi:hypothetical protein
VEKHHSTVISKYTGRKRTKAQIDRKYGDGRADYAICNSRGNCIDANYTTDAAARFANGAHGTHFHNNAKLKGRQVLRLKATRKIPANREIFTMYGNEYWGK